MIVCCLALLMQLHGLQPASGSGLPSSALQDSPMCYTEKAAMLALVARHSSMTSTPCTATADVAVAVRACDVQGAGCGQLPAEASFSSCSGNGMSMRGACGANGAAECEDKGRRPAAEGPDSCTTVASTGAQED